jgi:hypothetical protein
MSKKLIAVASAAALALSALVGIAPASAAPFSVGDLEGANSGAGATAAAPAKINVPSEDVFRFASDGGSTTGTVIRFPVTATGSGVAITVTATGSVRLLTATQFGTATSNVKTGTTTLSLTSDGSSEAEFYAYNTSTTTGSVTINEGAASTIRFVQGVTGAFNAYTMNFTAPTATSPGAMIEFSGTVVDMFGNNVEGVDFVAVGLGGDLTGSTNVGDPDYDAVTKVYSFEIANRDSAGNAAWSISLDAATKADEKKSSFGAQVSNQFFTVNAADLSAVVTALQSQVAALQAQLDASRLKVNSVTKKRWNNLVLRHRALGGSAKLK